MEAIEDGSCITDNLTPLAYCVRPLLVAEREDNESIGLSACLEWLDLRPSRSITFSCFGSWGRFSATQLEEIAVRLERSWQRFMWVVRNSSAEEVLVLDRESIRGFVTHCGWNLVLESIHAGMSRIRDALQEEFGIGIDLCRNANGGMVILYKVVLNNAFSVEEAKQGLPLKADEDGFATASEIEERVRELMESKARKAIAERTMGLKEKVTKTLSVGKSLPAK